MPSNQATSYQAIFRDADSGVWYEYHHQVDTILTQQPDKVVDLLAHIEQRVESEGVFAVGFLTYEAAAAFDSGYAVRQGAKLPLLYFVLYQHRRPLEHLPLPAGKPSSAWSLDIDVEEYERRVADLKEQIGAGAFYQVNYTARLKSESNLDVRDLARMAQQAPFGAYLEADNFVLVSASPELFFSKRGVHLVSRPMKGTAARGLSVEDDNVQARWLRESCKNRAENLMITDMVRNDMGRVAKVGSVHVPSLFEVEQHPTVWQMTSTVAAESECALHEIFAALFPAASITGAPKHASMQCIRQIETSPREIYTGAIGAIGPGGQADFSVAIRTAWYDKNNNQSVYGAGGGIVWDSNPADEYQELLTKTQILQAGYATFDLFETLRWTPEEGFYLLDRHLDRLRNSAGYHGFRFALEHVEDTLRSAADTFSPTPQRVRLQLTRTGDVIIEAKPFVQRVGVQRLRLVGTPVCKADVRLYHKTTDRSIYDAYLEQVADDEEPLLYNEAGFITETAIANVVFELNDKRLTPPVSDGLLPGTLRAHLLATGEIQESSLHVDQLPDVSAWYLVNALRGWRPAELIS